jgi:hypothetical protein
MANSADCSVWNPSNPMILHIAVTESTIQFERLCVPQMIEKDRLIDRLPGEDREDGKEDFFCLVLISMEGDRSKKNQGDKDKKVIDFFHTYFIILDRISVCQEKSLRGRNPLLKETRVENSTGILSKILSSGGH